jgi:hypothetical protein
MKKQIKKLSLNKKTISNLQPSEMKKIIGGATSVNYSHGHGGCNGGHTGNCSQNQNTCPGHNTCYNC